MIRVIDKKTFIEKSKIIHGDKYDYSLVDYKKSKLKVNIICYEHGEFQQSPSGHLKGNGCTDCAGIKKHTNNTFIEKSNIVHNFKYDYSSVDYIGVYNKVKIICPEHGVFEQIPNYHLNGCGCSDCGGTKKLTTEIFIEKSNIVHNFKYDYFLVNYINNSTKVKIICPEHGEFEQVPISHLNGNGCSKCYNSKGEDKIRLLLDNHNIRYCVEKTFNDCRNIKLLRFDFYLPDHNICIEYDGIQHYKPVDFFGGDDRLLEQQKVDKIKTEYCENNNIKLIRVSYKDDINIKLNLIYN